MWTDTTRAQYARADWALPSDLTDAEWALLEPLFAAVVCRPPAQMAAQADCRGDPVSFARRSAVADAATVLSAGLDSAALVLPVAGQPALVVAQSCPCC
jgi:hypothetical protein